ncbi:hypothetical protein HYPSUDRAFT_894384 [Hypholoma sublateritium FD-334 SS-4]|uniref:Uncharacterized protein n=1 Tax=Hypholoma sublateritium (strain FD-334 SS-4) TaxID=945553 RepID=A0A0D2NRD5_HYPSF|nr:hypothetical protein HYPSUDRAFT_894384 [Hypholoma sublateritium FD-334 SS-4]
METRYGTPPYAICCVEWTTPHTRARATAVPTWHSTSAAPLEQTLTNQKVWPTSSLSGTRTLASPSPQRLIDILRPRGVLPPRSSYATRPNPAIRIHHPDSMIERLVLPPSRSFSPPPSSSSHVITFPVPLHHAFAAACTLSALKTTPSTPPTAEHE